MYGNLFRMKKTIDWPRRKIRELYAWTTKWAQHEHAARALAFLSFIEAIIFPIPPDPLLLAMVFTKTSNWFRYATITVGASIAGGVVGYYFGFALFESVGQWIVDAFHLQQEYEDLGHKFSDGSIIAVFTAALTPVPFKLITITAGAFKVSLIDFLIGAILGRSLRFYAIAFLAKLLGKRYREQIERYIDVISIVLVAVLVILVLLVR